MIFVGTEANICGSFGIKDQKSGYKNGISDEKKYLVTALLLSGCMYSCVLTLVFLSVCMYSCGVAGLESKTFLSFCNYRRKFFSPNLPDFREVLTSRKLVQCMKGKTPELDIKIAIQSRIELSAKYMDQER